MIAISCLQTQILQRVISIKLSSSWSAIGLWNVAASAVAQTVNRRDSIRQFRNRQWVCKYNNNASQVSLRSCTNRTRLHTEANWFQGLFIYLVSNNQKGTSVFPSVTSLGMPLWSYFSSVEDGQIRFPVLSLHAMNECSVCLINRRPPPTSRST